ncbi:protein of unknown function [Enterobacter cancerogenus]|nr:protein of unknown function [Enterobacter cancerogenus]
MLNSYPENVTSTNNGSEVLDVLKIHQLHEQIMMETKSRMNRKGNIPTGDPVGMGLMPQQYASVKAYRY